MVETGTENEDRFVQFNGKVASKLEQAHLNETVWTLSPVFASKFSDLNLFDIVLENNSCLFILTFIASFTEYCVYSFAVCHSLFMFVLAGFLLKISQTRPLTG